MSRVAVVQMQSVDDLQENLTAAAGFIRDAVSQGAEFVTLPENFAFLGRSEKDKSNLSEHFGAGPIQDFIAEQAVRHGVWLLAGSIPLRAEGDVEQPPEKVFAASLLYTADGQCVARYDKIHLFDVEVPGKSGERYMESASHHAGSEPVVVKTPFGQVGLSICYDLRFPELYRQLVSRGAEILTVPAAFTEATGRVHWDMLLRARAVENQCYVLAADQWGVHPGGRRTYGGSQIVDPWGEVVARIKQGAGAVVADLKLDYLKEIRRRFPALKHRRLSQDA